MRIFAFIEQYCQDIIEKVHAEKQMIDLSGFPFDELVPGPGGKQTPVVYVDGVAIPIRDFFTHTREDFMSDYNLPSAGEAYDNYLDNFIILEGEQALSHLRLSLQDEMDRLKEDLVETGVSVQIG